MKKDTIDELKLAIKEHERKIQMYQQNLDRRFSFDFSFMNYGKLFSILIIFVGLFSMCMTFESINRFILFIISAIFSISVTGLIIPRFQASHWNTLIDEQIHAKNKLEKKLRDYVDEENNQDE